MLSIRDCLDYCDLTDDEVSLIAEHEGIPTWLRHRWPVVWFRRPKAS